MATTIWQKLNKQINAIKIFKNSATVIINDVYANPLTGVTTRNAETATITCPQPEVVRAGATEGTLAGDLRVMFDYISVRKAHSGLKSAEREWNEATGIFSPGEDELIFGGVRYMIREVVAEDWQNNQPGLYVLTLRAKSTTGEQ